MLTEHRAKLLAEVALPNAYRLVNHAQGVHRTADKLLVGMPTDDQLVVYDVNRLLGGIPEPVASFPANWVMWSHTNCSFTPDLTAAVFAERDRVAAVDQTGEVQWSMPYVDDPYDVGSTLVTADGSLVWAVVPGGETSKDWLVLDAADGRVLARTELLDWREPTPLQFANPDGEHVMVGFAEQDYASIYCGRFNADSASITASGGKTYDRSLRAIDPTGERCVLVSHYDVTVETSFEGRSIAELSVKDLSNAFAGFRLHQWEQAGFLSPTKVLASATSYQSQAGTPTHWVFDVAERVQLEQVHYPLPLSEYDRAMCHFFWPLGDGTWLTGDDDTLRLWSLDD